MNWRTFALGMTAACGGLLVAQGAFLGGFLLGVFAVFLACITHKWVR